MKRKKQMTIYCSSSDALWKLAVSCLTIGISLASSIWDDKACYISIMVQSICNLYDFSQFTNGNRYTKKVVVQSGASVITSVLAIICSIGFFINNESPFNDPIIELISIGLVTLPILFVYFDYNLNLTLEENASRETKKEND